MCVFKFHFCANVNLQWLSKIYTRALPDLLSIISAIISLSSSHPSRKTLNSVLGPLHIRRGLLFTGGICLVCSSCLRPCQCPPGSLVHFVGPFLSYPQLFGISICSVLSSLLPHLSDWCHIRSEGVLRPKNGPYKCLTFPKPSRRASSEYVRV